MNNTSSSGFHQDRKTWSLNHVLIVGYLRGACRLSSRFSSDQIHRAIGILRTNAVRVDPGKPGHAAGIGLFPRYSLLNHSCLCNTATVKRADFSLSLLAVSDIAAGEEITTRYTTPQWGTLRRQQMLQRQWFFSCGCRRCRDPTEFGTMLNAVRCKECQGGYQLPKEPRRKVVCEAAHKLQS